VPDFIVLHTTSATGSQRVWVELGRFTVAKPAMAFRAVGPPEPGEYLVLPVERQFTASVKTTVAVVEPPPEPEPPVVP
jgi:hypothetical protein